MKKIITAIGNPYLNNKLKKINNFFIINNDIQYQEGIIEFLELNSDINFLILSELLPGEYSIFELIEKINNINSKIKIILIIENKNNKEKYLKLGINKIIINNEVEINNLIKIINDENKMEKYNEEIKKEIDELKKYILKKENKNNKLIRIKNIKKIIFKNKNNLKNNNKIITVLGNNGSGKSLVTVMLAKAINNNKKILIIDFDVLNNSIHKILGVKKYSEKINKLKNNSEKINIEKLIIKINKKIDLISEINLLFNSENKIEKNKLINYFNLLKLKYDLILIDTSSKNFFEYNKELINISDKCIFLTEANLLEISKSKRFLDYYFNNWKIEKNKINIIFNKYNKNCIDINLLKKLFSDYKIIGKIKLKNNYNLFINNNFKKIKIKNNLIKKYNYFENKLINNNY